MLSLSPSKLKRPPLSPLPLLIPAPSASINVASPPLNAWMPSHALCRIYTIAKYEAQANEFSKKKFGSAGLLPPRMIEVCVCVGGGGGLGGLDGRAGGGEWEIHTPMGRREDLPMGAPPVLQLPLSHLSPRPCPPPRWSLQPGDSAEFSFLYSPPPTPLDEVLEGSAASLLMYSLTPPPPPLMYPLPPPPPPLQMEYWRSREAAQQAPAGTKSDWVTYGNDVEGSAFSDSACDPLGSSKWNLKV